MENQTRKSADPQHSIFMMSTQENFTEWAIAQGVEIKGIAIHKFPGRGFGIIAQKDFETEETVLNVPGSALHNITTVPKSITTGLATSALPISVNGILALSLLQSTGSKTSMTPWDAILPTPNDILESVPFNWHPTLQSLLPAGASLLLDKQQKKIAQDYSAVSASFPDTNYRTYVYNWFLVSTRTFYYTIPTPTGKSKKKEKPLDHDDCISLAPFADCFNHTPHGSCSVTFSPTGYTLTTNTPIKSGEELSISYGNHSNDFLLAEYGFILSDENTWDEVPLDSLFLPLFSSSQKEALKEARFLGKWVLDKDGVCYRTQVAIRLLLMTASKWERLVASGVEGGDKSQREVDTLLVKTLKPFTGVIAQKLKDVKLTSDGLESQRETMMRRWSQIRILVAGFLERVDIQKS